MSPGEKCTEASTENSFIEALCFKQPRVQLPARIEELHWACDASAGQQWEHWRLAPGPL